MVSWHGGIWRVDEARRNWSGQLRKEQPLLRPCRQRCEVGSHAGMRSELEQQRLWPERLRREQGQQRLRSGLPRREQQLLRWCRRSRVDGEHDVMLTARERRLWLQKLRLPWRELL